MPVDDPQLFLLDLYEGAGQAEATKEPQDTEVGVHGLVYPTDALHLILRLLMNVSRSSGGITSVSN